MFGMISSTQQFNGPSSSECRDEDFMAWSSESLDITAQC